MSTYRDPITILQDLMESGLTYDESRREAIWQAEHVHGDDPELARQLIDDTFIGASIALRARVWELLHAIGHGIGRLVVWLRR